ncbi:hypothetical protein [Paenibacillus sp. sgz302251]|uniref:hypothetical protein n=1 Tax=Paenibacillus sp. sgz302251 TaxID=3414493 RepID=UPI003C7DA404
MTQDMNFTLVETFFHISPVGARNPTFQMPATDFLDRQKARQAIMKGGDLVQAIGMQLATSFIGMSFFNLCVTKLIFAAQYNRLLDLTINNLTFQLEKHGNFAHFGFKINDLRWTDLPGDNAARNAFLIADFSSYFEREINMMIEAVAESVNMKSDMIWGQFGGQYHSIRDYIRQHENFKPSLEQFEQGFKVLIGLPPAVFNRKRNPFEHKPRYIDNPWSPPDGKFMLRSSCCMYDCRVDGQKCYTCPRMLPEEREEKRRQVLAAAAT